MAKQHDGDKRGELPPQCLGRVAERDGQAEQTATEMAKEMRWRRDYFPLSIFII